MTQTMLAVLISTFTVLVGNLLNRSENSKLAARTGHHGMPAGRAHDGAEVSLRANMLMIIGKLT